MFVNKGNVYSLLNLLSRATCFEPKHIEIWRYSCVITICVSLKCRLYFLPTRPQSAVRAVHGLPSPWCMSTKPVSLSLFSNIQKLRSFQLLLGNSFCACLQTTWNYVISATLKKCKVKQVSMSCDANLILLEAMIIRMLCAKNYDYRLRFLQIIEH